MPSKKKIAPHPEPFLKTAAEAIGSALGKLAVKTGIAKQTGVSEKRPNAPRGANKKAQSARTKAAKVPSPRTKAAK